MPDNGKTKAFLAGSLLLLVSFATLAAPAVRRGPLVGGAPAVRPATVHARSSVRPAPGRVDAKRPSAPVRRDVPPMTGKPAPKGAGPMAPYRSAIAMDADTGRVLYADFENRTAFPASVTKLMTFLLVLEDLQAGRYSLSDVAVGSSYAASMEPSKVDLRPGQAMTIEDLLFAIMVKSANDAAVILAEHAAWVRAGGKGRMPVDPKWNSRELVDAFVTRMNRRAQELGMDSTRYYSPNGLPPGLREKRGFDTSTAADQARLCRRIVRMPGALRYTSAAHRTVTVGEGETAVRLGLSAHNYFLPGTNDKNGLVRPVPGCDGLKTGYTAASGSSIALTAARKGRRVVVVVLGSAGRHEREAAANRILNDALGAVSLW